jgi:hypothetical protein
MLLSEMTLPVPYADCKDLALVYPYEIAVALYGVQEEHGDPRHVPVGRQLTDGRWMLCGDVLSEVGEGGILSQAFSFITPEMMASVEVVPLADLEFASEGVPQLVPEEEPPE